MDETLRDTIRTLAKENGLDPEALEKSFISGEMPPELLEAMTAILGDVGMFGYALKNLDK